MKRARKRGPYYLGLYLRDGRVSVWRKCKMLALSTMLVTDEMRGCDEFGLMRARDMGSNGVTVGRRLRCDNERLCRRLCATR